MCLSVNSVGPLIVKGARRGYSFSKSSMPSFFSVKIEH